MESKLWQMLRGLHAKNQANCAYVFWSQGRRNGDFRKVWKSACKKASMPGMLFHDFRRTAMRNMIRAGIPERVAMEIDRYNIVSAEDLNEAARKRGVKGVPGKSVTFWLHSAPKRAKGYGAASVTP